MSDPHERFCWTGRARNALDAVTETVEALKEAKTALSDADPVEAAVKGEIGRVLGAITALD